MYLTDGCMPEMDKHMNLDIIHVIVVVYFKTKPFACDPSSLPKYPPTKEIDARSREDAHRRRIQKVAGRARAVEVARRPLRVHRDPQDSSGSSRLSNNTETESNMNNNATDSSNEKLACPRVTGDTRFFVDLQPVAALKPPYQVRHVSIFLKGHSFLGPLHVNPSSGFAWVKKPQEDRPLVKAHHKYSSRNSGCVGREPPTAIRAKVTSDIDNIAEVPAAEVALELPEGIEQHRIMKTAMLKNWAQLECPHSLIRLLPSIHSVSRVMQFPQNTVGWNTTMKEKGWNSQVPC
ncbi:hypothetical protein HPP92_023291 [Vanilla planifolia]|uniref:Uncharacterized protein n=1 Tax=Vanilla planifolia TaxID=51239 RepID=A0A835UG83_VANPL|nr:hypothetical protein HPP92_023291 [Vanilla planifolia]